MLIDTHCHLFQEYYNDIEVVLKSACNYQISKLISSGVDNLSNKEMLELASKYPNVYITLGLHPEVANIYNVTDLELIKKNMNNSKVVAIGEIGLDYHYEGYTKEKQIELFKKQLDIAQKANLPVVIHSREATEDTINILKEYSLRGVIHSFSGSKATAREYIKLGYKLGINGVVTFKNAHIKDVIKEIGLEHFVLETDSPYLTPEPNRGKKNQPANVADIAIFLASYLGVPVNDIIAITSANSYVIFDKLK